ncbi:MAG: ATP-dependent Clp protease proteolytic subunit [Fibrobacteria bacterium]|nr:ATP-dependent Clp protease proteolytic subunit [Fibrobacteria bacterium]
MNAKCDDKDKKEEPSLEKEIQESFIKGRKIFLWKQVDDESAEKLVKQMMYLDSVNHNDIFFFINSPGGVITSGLAIYDCMQAVKSKVNTIVCGQAASMGAVLLSGGAKGKRFAWPNSRILIHQPLIQGHIYGPASDIEIQAEEMLKMRETLNGILAKHSGQTVEVIEKDTDRDNFMTPEQAKKYGLIDGIKNIM